MSYLIPCALVVVAIGLLIGLRRANELFVLNWRAGELRIVRGRMPHRLHDDFCDVLAKAKVDHARLRVVVADGRAALRGSQDALPKVVQQRLRNVLGQWPVARIRQSKGRRR